ncbi:methyltransferase, partial [Streptomyces albidoflavus]
MAWKNTVNSVLKQLTGYHLTRAAVPAPRVAPVPAPEPAPKPPPKK